LIYRREFPNSPSKRFRTTILNPLGNNLNYKALYKNHQKLVGKHHGTKVCLRRKKTQFRLKFNLYYGMPQNIAATVSEVSLARRYKTLVGLIIFSNGSMSVIPLFNGASIGSIIRTPQYVQTPKIHLFRRFRLGDYVPVAYLSLMTCFFNISYTRTNFSWFCRAGGTFCTMIRFNMNKGQCTIKLPSNKYRIILESSYVMLGRNSNLIPKGILIGKAGLNIKKGFRPTVRGVAKNPVDHPHGGRTKSNSPERTP